jgi:hypothetical protein
MVKANSHHGLDRKFKPWRRGKSQHSKGKTGSRKNQIRGLRRLFQKTTDEGHKKKIQEQIAELEEEVGDKVKTDKEKDNARKSHGARFLERQRLTRLWQTASKAKASTEREQEQHRIGLDMLYVAHYPHEARYEQLFRQGTRVNLDGRNLARRAASRGKILAKVSSLDRVSWVPAQVYENCPSDWSSAKERETFGSVTPLKVEDTSVKDDRFTTDAAAAKHSVMLQAVEAVDADLDEDEAKDLDLDETSGKGTIRTKEDRGQDSDSSSEGIVSEDEDESDDADPLSSRDGVSRKRKDVVGDSVMIHSPDVEDAKKKAPGVEDAKKNAPDDNASSASSSSSSDSSSSSSSDEDSDDDDEATTPKAAISETAAEGKSAPGDADVDDFLMSTETATDIFANAKEQVPSVDEFRGDKSKGWATQRQRPGEFKKKRTR